MKRPLVQVVLFLIAGQALARNFVFPTWSIALGFLLVFASAAYLLRNNPRPDEPARSRGLLIFVLFALIGIAGQQRIERCVAIVQEAYEDVAEQRVLLEGVANGLSIEKSDGWSVALENVQLLNQSKAKLPGLVLLNAGVEKELAPALPGQRIRVSGRLDLPEPPGNPHQFDYAAYLQSRGIAATIYVPTHYMLDISEPEEGLTASQTFLRAIAMFRAWSYSQIDRFIGGQWQPLMRSLLFGDTHLLDESLKEMMSRTGLAHLMAVSGQHAAFISLLVFVVLRMIGAPWKVTWIVTAVTVWAFAILVGMQPPVIRAAILTTALASAYLIGRDPDPLNSLALSALIVLIHNPHALYKADLQLSYMCVLSIILLRPGLSRWLMLNTENVPSRQRRRNLAFNKWIGLPLVFSFASQIGLVPLLSWHFHLFPVIGFLANIIMVPLSGLIVMAGFLTIFTGAILPPIGAVLGFACKYFLIAFEGLARGFSSVPYASIPLPPMPSWAIGAYFLILFSGCYIVSARAPGEVEKTKWRLAIHLAALVSLIVWLAVLNAPRSELAVRMLDVGQGDSILIQSPSGQNILVDGGPEQAGKYAVVAFLRAHGISRLNAVVATHPDSDHIGGLIDVLQDFPVDLFVMSPTFKRTETIAELESVIRSKSIPTKMVARGDILDGLSQCQITVLNPQSNSFAEDNDLSIVLRLDHGENSFLLTGDASEWAEADMLSASIDLDCDVLKAGHHGARSSSSMPFVHAVSPELVLVSVGRDNRYGHPHEEALERFQREKGRVLRTDQQGAISILSDGENLRAMTALRHE